MSLFVSINGTNIYRVERDPYDDQKPGYSQFWYSVKEGAWMDENVFDVRDLSTWQGTGAVTTVAGYGAFATEGVEINRAIRVAVESGELAAHLAAKAHRAAQQREAIRDRLAEMRVWTQ